MSYLEETVGLAQLRSQCYAVLSLAFCTPGLEMLTALKGGEALSTLFEDSELLPLACPELKELSDFLSGEKEKLLPELYENYVNLFFGSPHLMAPPYESVYTAGGYVMGEPALKVQKLYEAEGLELAPTFKDLPDHIAAELEFMSFLSQKEATTWEGGVLQRIRTPISKEEVFLRGHLCRWLPQFSRRVKETRVPFYSPLVQIVDDFTRFDLLHLSALLQAMSKNGEDLQ